MNDQASSRWLCQFQGCTKSFSRKEHLTRHQKSHSDTSPAHICRVCHKQFSRSDGLQRHLGRHGQEFKKQTGRSKRACTSCHVSKIKCDGNDPCSRCEKKKISCTYGLRQESPAIAGRIEQDEASQGVQGGDMSDEEGSEISMSESLPDTENSAGMSLGSRQISDPMDALRSGQAFNVPQVSDHFQRSNPIQTSNPFQTSSFTVPTLFSSQSPHEPSIRTKSPNSSLIVENSNSVGQGSSPRRIVDWSDLPRGLVDWSNLRIQQDPPKSRETSRSPQRNDELPTSKLEHLCSLAEETVDRYRNLYFAHFHDRWPIIHSITFEEEEGASEILLPSILMIGGWIDGTTNSRDWALKVHHSLVEHIVPRLCEPNDIDTMTQHLPIVLYQCTLLNIIFVSYCGKHDILAKGLLMRNLLAASIYEVGILTRGTIYVDDKPGFFLPLHLVKQQQRQRIAVDLFKIDTYFSVIKSQPPLIKPEELHFSIPETIAHWNANGLPIWEFRRPDEPKSRSQRSIDTMLEEVALGTIEFSENESMLEDIQICLWAMQSQISQLSNQSQPERRNEMSLSILRESLKRQLESLKRGFTKLSTKISGPEIFEQADHSTVRYYYGSEDHDEPGWEPIVSRRIHSFIFDTFILHHLMNLQLFTETQTLRMLAKHQSLSSTTREVFKEVYTHPHAQRLLAARTWTQEPNSRRALWHATEILLSHNKLNTTPSLANFIPDPISYIAVASAALVIWAHCMYGQEICNTLASASISVPHKVGMSIELTKLSEVINGSSYDEKGKEVWVEGVLVLELQLKMFSCVVVMLGF